MRLVVQRRVAQAGLDPAGFSAHSLRAGLATSAAAMGVAKADIQRQTRHRSVAVLRGYVRPASVFLSNASGRGRPLIPGAPPASREIGL